MAAWTTQAGGNRLVTDRAGKSSVEGCARRLAVAVLGLREGAASGGWVSGLGWVGLVEEFWRDWREIVHIL